LELCNGAWSPKLEQLNELAEKKFADLAVWIQYTNVTDGPTDTD